MTVLTHKAVDVTVVLNCTTTHVTINIWGMPQNYHVQGNSVTSIALLEAYAPLGSRTFMREQMGNCTTSKRVRVLIGVVRVMKLCKLETVSVQTTLTVKPRCSLHHLFLHCHFLRHSGMLR